MGICASGREELPVSGSAPSHGAGELVSGMSQQPHEGSHRPRPRGSVPCPTETHRSPTGSPCSHQYGQYPGNVAAPPHSLSQRAPVHMSLSRRPAQGLQGVPAQGQTRKETAPLRLSPSPAWVWTENTKGWLLSKSCSQVRSQPQARAPSLLCEMEWGERDGGEEWDRGSFPGAPHTTKPATGVRGDAASPTHHHPLYASAPPGPWGQRTCRTHPPLAGSRFRSKRSSSSSSSSRSELRSTEPGPAEEGRAAP